MAHHKRAERIESLSEKVCVNGHKGDWLRRNPSGDSSTTYCATCARESIARHREKKGGTEVWAQSRRLPNLTTKQQVEERWARSVLASAPNQVAQLQARLKEMTAVVEEAHEVIKKTTDTELLEFALVQVREMSRIIQDISK